VSLNDCNIGFILPYQMIGVVESALGNKALKHGWLIQLKMSTSQHTTNSETTVC